MDKQELTEKYIRILQEMKSGSEFEHIYRTFLSELLQLDEPQKPAVPQFVADWIEYFKNCKGTLYGSTNPFSYYGRAILEDFEGDYEEVLRWIRDNSDTYARAWLDGYEIEQEKRYRVKVKATKHFLVRDGMDRMFFSLAYKSLFTKKQLEEAGFEWVFGCPGIEIEEVGDDSN